MLCADREARRLRTLLDINTLSFPGLGIGDFQVNEIAFTVFGRNVAWYGIIVTIAIISVCAVIYRKSIRAGIKTDDILDYFIFCIVFGIVGARLYYVIFDGIGNYVVTEGNLWDRVSGTLYNIAAVWEGGIAIYGGITAIVVTVYVVSKIKHLSVLNILDMGGHAALLGQAIGRWGNFVNAEAHGVETDIFCRMGITNALGVTRYYHPTFLYESVWNIVGFFIILRLLRRQKYDGQAFLWYISWYGFGRMLIEGLRTDSLYIGSTGIRVSQLLAFCLFTGGVAALAVIGHKRRGIAAAQIENESDDSEDSDASDNFDSADEIGSVQTSDIDTEITSSENGWNNNGEDN